MKAFEWANAKSIPDAVKLLQVLQDQLLGPDDSPHPMGGGQDLLTTMKAYIVTPPRVVNLKTIPNLANIDFDAAGGGLKIGATATLTQIAEHDAVQKFAPGLVQAIHSVATPQIRNVGTIGGNLLQRPRCWYFRLDEVKCLKRGGDTCYAREGENKYHAVFGTDAPCVMVHPSDLAPMLVALSAVVVTHGPTGEQLMPADQFFRMPTQQDVRTETVLAPGAIVKEIRIADLPGVRHSTYLKFKERQSLDFAMASVAASVALTDDKDRTVQFARIVLGGVAPIPWELKNVNTFLVGKKLDEATVNKAAEIAIEGAKPLSQNGYKLPLTRTLVRRALMRLA